MPPIYLYLPNRALTHARGLQQTQFLGCGPRRMSPSEDHLLKNTKIKKPWLTVAQLKKMHPCLLTTFLFEWFNTACKQTYTFPSVFQQWSYFSPLLCTRTWFCSQTSSWDCGKVEKGYLVWWKHFSSWNITSRTCREALRLQPLLLGFHSQECQAWWFSEVYFLPKYTAMNAEYCN